MWIAGGRAASFAAGDDLKAVRNRREAHAARNLLAQLDDLLGGKRNHLARFQIHQVVMHVGTIYEIVVRLFTTTVRRWRHLIEQPRIP